MSVQGYSLSFRPKKNRPPSQDARSEFSKLLEQLESFSAYIKEFLPSQIRPKDGLPLSDADHEGGLKKLDCALKSITSLAPFRVICAPAEELKSRQWEILRELERIPVHRSAHGFVPGKNALSCAQAHLSYWGERPKGLVLLNVDVEGFFHSISRGLVITALEKHDIAITQAQIIADHCVLRANPELAVEALSRLGEVMGNSKKEMKSILLPLGEVLSADIPVLAPYSHLILKDLLGLGPLIQPGDGFLPQGAPTSPVLSNLVCKIIDIRLSAMAKAFGAFYTRYADDLTFSWPAFTKGKVIDGMKRCSAEVMKEYGMYYNPKKIRVVGPGGSQDIVGYVINSGRPTVSQRFRTKIREDIERERDSRKKTSAEIIERLHGQAGYIQPLHFKEAQWMKAEIEKLNYKTNRSVKKAVIYEETVESPETTSRRKVARAA